MRVHQVLHGYSDGHRLLAGSVPNEIGTSRQLLVLSDASNANLRSDHEGYLTGYPLQGTKFYAFARTWPAPEMPRPGCVWTHTLLIGFSDLAVLKSTKGLLQSFRRPQSPHVNEAQGYGYSFEAPEIVGPDSPTIDFEAVERLLNGLYAYPSESIFWATDSLDAEEILLSIWMQQWPRLRRAFRFCTFSSLERSNTQGTFDIQIVPENSILRSKEKLVLGGSESLSRPRWIAVASDDISEGGGELRKFLWRYGADTDAGRHAFRPLVRLFLAFRFEPHVRALDAVLEEPGFDGLGSGLRSHVANTLATSLEPYAEASVRAIKFLADHVDLVDPGVLRVRSTQIAQAMYSADPSLLVQLLKRSDGSADLVVASGVRLFSGEELRGLDADTLLKAIHLCPDVIVTIFGYEGEQDGLRFTLEQAAKNPILSENIVVSAIKSRTDLIAGQLVESLGYVAVSSVIRLIDNDEIERDSASNWLRAISAKPRFVLKKLREGSIKKLCTIQLLAERIDYRYSDSERRDPWYRAVRRTKEKPDETNYRLLCFLLARAFSRSSNQPAKLLEAAFDPVFRGVAQNRLSPADWSLLAHELPQVAWWRDWDKCYRLLAGAAKLAVIEEFSSRQFLRITSDDHAFSQLVRETRSRLGGRDYLRALLQRGSKIPRSRVAQIEMAISY